MLPVAAWIAASLSIGQAAQAPAVSSRVPQAGSASGGGAAGVPDAAGAAQAVAVALLADTRYSDITPVPASGALLNLALDGGGLGQALASQASAFSVSEVSSGVPSWVEAVATEWLPHSQLQSILQSAAAFSAFTERGASHPPVERGPARWLAGGVLLALLVWMKLSRHDSRLP